MKYHRVMVNTPYSTGLREYHKPRPLSKSIQDFATEEGEFAGQLFLFQALSPDGGRWINISRAFA